MSASQIWSSPPQFVDGNGAPYSGAFLFFYAAGSATKQNIYTDSTGGTPASNPLTLNSSGYPTASGNIFVPFGTVGQTYKIGLAAPGSADPPASFIWTADNIGPIATTVAAATEWVAGPTPTYISATSFSLVGDQTSTFQVGRRVKTTNSGGTVYSTIITSAFGAITTVTLVNDSGTLDSGLSAVSYALLSYTNPSYYTANSFTATLTGCTTAPTYSVKYTRIGDLVTLNVPTGGATSNATTKTLTGCPAALWPASIKEFASRCSDNGGATAASIGGIAPSGVISLYPTGAQGNWTNSGSASWGAFQITYSLA